MTQQESASDQPGEIRLPLTIRLARQSDLEALEWFGLFTHYRQVMANTLAAQQRGTAYMLVALVNHFPVGQLCIDLTRHERKQQATIWALRVFQPFQSSGLGRNLMVAAEARILAHGWQLVELGVDHDNARVLPFYERLGYRITGQERGQCYYRDHKDQLVCEPVEQWLLTKSLAAGAPAPSPDTGIAPLRTETQPTARPSGWGWWLRR